VTSQLINPGHTGKITLLLENLSKFPRTIRRGDRIAQVVFISAKDNPFWYRTSPLAKNEHVPKFSNLTLGNEFGIFKESERMETLTVSEGKSFVLNPDEFILGITQEEVYLDSKNVVGMLVYTSSNFYKRMYVLEGLLNPGFKGKIVLEIKNRGSLPVELYPGEEIYRIFYCPAFTFGSYASSKSKYVGVDKTSHPQL
jgi:deoxycytidine triphosphate deaminase